MPNYDYYTDLRVVVSNEDWSKVSLQRVEELYAIAKDDIRANKKAQQKSLEYDFDNKQREERAIQTRSEIYDLYNLRKEIINESSSSDDNQFGVVGYNGVCSTVTVNGGTVSLDDYIITAFTKPGQGFDTISTYVEAVTKKESLPIQLRAFTTVLFIIVMGAMFIISMKLRKRSER